ncbi:MAG: cobalamin-binding protein [Deltaproteobacteria bacterium]|nr:cobalamin-binding protein [Deltaproteobacteria bacterium]
MRIVSLLPSATEILCALGAADDLVGVSHECDHPPQVRALPKLTRPKIRIDARSAVIDRDVRALVARGLSVYEIDVDRLRALAPDVIVTQQQCDVCAVSFAEVEAAVRNALERAPVIVSLTPRVLADVWEDVQRVAVVLDRTARAEELIASARARLAALAERTAELPRPVVACLDWLEPPMTAGNWIPELVATAGGAYPFAVAGAPSATISWQALRAAVPEVLVLMPCGFTIPQTERELAALTEREEWRALPAVRDGRVSMVDGSAYFNRPGPRLVDSAEILAGLVHPEICDTRFAPEAVLPLARA